MDSKFRCMKCGFQWAGYTLMWHWCSMYCPLWCPRNGKRGPQRPGGGMTECPKCANIYVEWVNWKEKLESLGRYWEE